MHRHMNRHTWCLLNQKLHINVNYLHGSCTMYVFTTPQNEKGERHTKQRKKRTQINTYNQPNTTITHLQRLVLSVKCLPVSLILSYEALILNCTSWLFSGKIQAVMSKHVFLHLLMRLKL